MATTFDSTVRARDDRSFFFVMACIMAATIVAGFSFNVVTGRSTFAVPLVFHLHALAFFGWVVLYVVQTGLVFSGSVALHKRLGWSAAILVPVMVALGMTMTIVSIRRGGPFFFDQNEFLFGNPAQLLAFAGLVYAAIALRKKTDWHRRLLFCAMAILTGPGLGRLLPSPLLIPWAWWVTFAATLVFPLVGMIADRRRIGRVHPAYLVGVAAMFGSTLLGDIIAYTPLGVSVTQQLIQGTPGAERPMHAYMPS